MHLPILIVNEETKCISNYLESWTRQPVTMACLRVLIENFDLCSAMVADMLHWFVISFAAVVTVKCHIHG